MPVVQRRAADPTREDIHGSRRQETTKARERGESKALAEITLSREGPEQEGG